MQGKLNSLRKEAEEAVRFRGHNIAWKVPFYYNNARYLQYGDCKKCNMEVMLNTNPLPNEIDISGEAVALHCKEVI